MTQFRVGGRQSDRQAGESKPPATAPGNPEGVSSSFDYVPVRELPGFVLDRERCTAIPLGLAGRDSSRALVAIVGGRVLVCATRTTDFGNAEIRHVVHARGQLYLDVSGKLQIDDFAADVHQLTLTSTCLGCRRLPRCSGAYSLSSGNYFAEDETWLRERLAGLTGVVLDIGAGRLPYSEALEAGVRNGALVLHGLDPQPISTGSDLPMTVHEATVEDARLPEGMFDACLAVRSLNHFLDAELALANVARWLKPGGRALLVESLPLPLLRDRGSASRAHALADGGFQHRRNWGSEEVLRVTDGKLPLRMVFHRPIGRGTTDQWILELERT